MFNTPRELNRHLIEDGFEGTLNIIDDYHVKAMPREAIMFYRDAFSDTNIREINIYYQIKELRGQKRLQREQEIAELSQIIGENPQTLTSFLVFIFTKLRFNGTLQNNLRNLYNSPKANEIIESALDFIAAFERVGIRVHFRPYTSLDFNPPFHGRYWLSEHVGYIVDGSLNNYLRAKVFAQIMDHENFEIIRNLFIEEVEPRAAHYNALDGETLNHIHTSLHNMFDEYDI